MRVLIACDKFKDALPARAVCEVVAQALAAEHPAWRLDLCPLTDGGEGFCKLLTHAAGGRIETVAVHGPRGDLVHAPVGFVPADQIPLPARNKILLSSSHSDGPRGVAVVELASASGLALLTPARRDPWRTTTLGTGELLRAAADRGAGAILLGLGGSATNDLGLGALDALGCEFLDASGARIHPPVPADWERIARIAGRVPAALPPVFIACDVSNPLLGPQGGTAVFGPQKGLRPADMPRLEAAATRMAALLCAHCGRPDAIASTPGAGAAGGTAFGLVAAARARLLPGSDLVSDWLDLPARLAAVDLVLTGEGRFDATSLAGKGPGAIVAEARRLGKTVHVFAGALDGVPADAAFHAISPPGLPLAAALSRTGELLAAAIHRHL